MSLLGKPGGFNIPAPDLSGLVRPSTVLPVVSSTYGVWNAAVQADPSGGLIRNTAQGAITSSLIFGAIGYLVPGLTAVEGLKWGAITGGAKALYSHFNRS